MNVVLKKNFDPKVKYTGLFVFAIKQNDFWYNGLKVLVSTVLSKTVQPSAELYHRL